MPHSRFPDLAAMAEPRLPLVPAVRAGDEDGGKDEGGSGAGQVGIATKTRAKPKKPSQYKVLMLNDDYTPMEFVVAVLERFFGMNHAQAFEIMLTVHKKGLAVVGVFSHEIAETKVAQVMDFARRHQHPLQCTMEKE
jgi:ATP-dependent Clp protease adaptor protein ClpS